eukprot:m.31849 g.31849  ORF g.31849 m.31849 type:complete len:70 (+) comp10725_c0_seq2:238-447(+)
MIFSFMFVNEMIIFLLAHKLNVSSLLYDHSTRYLSFISKEALINYHLQKHQSRCPTHIESLNMSTKARE